MSVRYLIPIEHCIDQDWAATQDQLVSMLVDPVRQVVIFDSHAPSATFSDNVETIRVSATGLCYNCLLDDARKRFGEKLTERAFRALCSYSRAGAE